MNQTKFDHRSHIGEIHGIYKIIDVLEEKDKYGHYIYVAECQECGYKKYSHYGNFSGKSSKTNICKHVSLGGKYVSQIKWTNNRIKNIFAGMKKRCYSKNNKAYRWYGAKGIKICDEWLDNPISFEEWSLKNGYSDTLTIDRIDESKDYSPDNCRWVTDVDNSKYKSTTNLINVDGEMHTGKDWSKILGFSTNVINKYIRNHGLENTIIFIKKYIENPNLKIKPRQSYYDLYMNYMTE